MTAGDPRVVRRRIRSSLRRALERLDEGGLDLAVADAVTSALLDATRKPKTGAVDDRTSAQPVTPGRIRHLVHDLRSASGTVVTWCHVLRRGGLSQPEIERAADVLERTMRRQIMLVERLAALAGANVGAEAGGGAGEPVPAAASSGAAPTGFSTGIVPTASTRVMPTAAVAANAAVDLRGIRVLIVDDDADARDGMQRILAACGAEVATAVSAIDAFDVLQRGRPDVLVSDIVMPDADGYALLRRVRAPDTGERGMIPAIAVTGQAEPGDRRRALGAGYQIHLVKPVEPGALIEAVRSLSGR